MSAKSEFFYHIFSANTTDVCHVANIVFKRTHLPVMICKANHAPGFDLPNNFAFGGGSLPFGQLEGKTLLLP
jgi:hypothetical protein